MRQKLLCFIVAIYALTVFQFIGKGQRKISDLEAYFKSLVFDDQIVPYRLTVKGGAVGFCNETANQVTGYRLGCVSIDKSELTILSEEDFKEIDLAPEQEDGSVSCRMTVANHNSFPLNQCKEGKLAITEVHFKDMDNWKLKP